MKKIIYGAIVIAVVSMFTYSCNNYDELDDTTDVSKVASDLQTIFDEIKANKGNVAARTSYVSVANANNPLDSVGELHNDGLDFLIGLSLDESNMCNSLPEINSEFGAHIGLSCNETLSVLDTLVGGALKEDYDYSSEYLENLYITRKISYDEFSVMNTTISNVYDMDLSQKIESIKAAEKYVIESTVLTTAEKDRVLGSFAVYRYSSFYWENEYTGTWRAQDGYGLIGSMVDMMAFYWASYQSLDSSAFQDGGDMTLFASNVSYCISHMLGI